MSNLYIADSNNARVRRVRSALPQFALESILVASEDGMLLYEFTPNGRHLRTVDTMTGKVLYTFSYTEEGYLSTIQDIDGDITRIERNNDEPVAIIAPDGQRTSLTVDANGYLNSVTNPAGESYQLKYTSDGLLTEFTNPRAYKSTYRYNQLGMLVEDTDAAGGGWTLARTEDEEGGYTATMTSKGGRVTTYQVKPQTDGSLLRIQTAPDGTKNQTLKKTNGETLLIGADGTQIVSKQGPDPRFGMQSPITEKVTITTPNGLISEVNLKETATLLNSNDPLSLQTLTTTVTTNGRVSTSVYKASEKKVTATTASGRQAVSYFDEKGRITKEEIPGLSPTVYSYDSRGRLIQTSVGTGEELRETHINYDAQGNIQSLTDSLNRQVSFTYDAVGRILSQTLTDGRIIDYQYDANGNVTSITPPSRPQHVFDYSAVDLQTEYTPPILPTVTQPQTQYIWNLDKQLTQIIRPDGQTIDFHYDQSKGRLNSLSLPQGEQTINYDGQGRVSHLTATDGSQLSYTYDGSLALSEMWTGSINGTLQLTYNNDFLVSSASVNGNSVSYQYDKDGLLTKAGAVTLTRNAQNGLLTGTTLGNIVTQRSYSSFGELQEETSSYQNTPLYHVYYSRDKAGRITQKIEIIDGITTTTDYRYDTVGRLIEVKQNGNIVETYQYDANGNRLNENAIYDQQDRLLRYGSNNYTYTQNGELLTKNNIQYHYDVLGNLRQVQLPTKTIDYVIDARNRRVGKKVNGQLVQGFLYQGDLKPIAELDGNGQIISRFVYGSKSNIPDYILKNGKTYRIISDHLGSPRVVVDITDGSVIQRMDFDAFGNVLFDSNPGFQPFGFAGGLYDVDTKLVRFGARDYDSEIGRWTGKDPIGFSAGINFYTYVGNDPVNYVDLDGLCESWLDFATELALGFIPGYDLYSAYNDPNPGWFDYGVAILGIIPGAGKGLGILGQVGKKGLKTWQEAKISIADAKRIQNAANRTNQEIIVVGSRASGGANPLSDWDYILSGKSSKRHSAVGSLPKGVAGGEINASGRETGIDVFQTYNPNKGNYTVLDSSKPHVIFSPGDIME